MEVLEGLDSGMTVMQLGDSLEALLVGIRIDSEFGGSEEAAKHFEKLLNDTSLGPTERTLLTNLN